ncbi:MAG: PAS domain S-box protein [Candidatus Brocadiia bacterium]
MSNSELSLNPERLRRRLHELETAAAPLTAEHDRQKRVKELRCLRLVSELFGREDISLETASREMVQALPDAWQYPEVACARIVLGAQEFKTKNYAESAWMQTQDILAGGRVAGSIQVGYLAEEPARDEGPFLKEERELLGVLAAMLAGFIGRRGAEEERGRSRDELEIQVEARVSQLKAANETVRAEIAERKGRDADLRTLNRTLKAHSRSARAMMRAANEADYLQEVCRIVVEDCGHAMVWIGFAEDDAAKTVRPVAYSGFEAGYLETLKLTWADTERGRGPTGTAIRTGKPGSCRNMLTDPAFAPWRAEAVKRGYGSSLVLPLMAGGKAFGAITIYERMPDAFSEDETDLLYDLADDLAFGITSLRMREAHARMEDELRSLALFPDENPGPVMRVSKDGTILYGNKTASPILACWGSGVGRATPKPVHRIVQEVLDSGLGRETELDCGERVFSLVFAPISDRGYVTLYGHDVTDRKRLENEVLRSRDELEVRVRERTRELLESTQRLRESQRIIQQIADTTPDIVYIFDFARRHIIYANRRAAEFMGYTMEHLSKPGLSFLEERIHTDDRDSVRVARERFATADESDVIEYEYRAKRADGQWRWLLVREALFARAQGGSPKQILGAALDITDRKEAEERLKTANALLEPFVKETARKPYLDSVVKILSEVSGCRNVGLRLLNDRGEIPYESSVGFGEDFVKREGPLCVHTDGCVCTRVVLGKPVTADDPMMTRKGAFCCNDTFKFVSGLAPEQQERYRGACPRAGFASLAVIPLRYRGTTIGALHFADIAPGKLNRPCMDSLESAAPLIAEAVYRFGVEERLRESEQKFRAIFDQVFQFIALLKPDGTVLEVNEPALSFANISLHDVLGRPLWDGRWWWAMPAAQKQLKEAVAAAALGRFVRYETKLQGEGESAIIADFSVKPVVQADGKAAFLIVEARDITEHKRLEQEILVAAGAERRRIGQDLHDGLGQQLAGIALLSRALQQRLAARDARAAEEAHTIMDLANQAATQSRALARGLCPVELTEDGLADALRELAVSTEKIFGIPCEFRCETPASVADSAVATHLFYITQEAVNNAVKHSRAGTITVSLSGGPDGISVRIKDDGVGMPERTDESNGLGLRTMRYRADAIGAFLDIRSVPPRGTIVRCYVRSPKAAVT